MAIPSNHLQSSVQSLLRTIKFNGVSQPISIVSIKYEMMHGLNQVVFRTKNIEMLCHEFVKFSVVL